MGIQGINEFLRKKDIKFSKEMECKKFFGKRIAIDAGKLLFESSCRVHKSLIMSLKNAAEKYSSRKFKSQFLEDALSGVLFFLKNKMYPIIIFDGERHEAKDACRDKRRNNSDKLREKIHSTLEEYKAMMENPLEAGVNTISDKELRRMRANLPPYISKENIEAFKEILESIGIPHFTAEYEAESLCCSLESEGKVYAVYTSDTDCYAFGISYMITKINPFNDKIEVTRISKILDWISEEFDCEDEERNKKFLRDFCIMIGCDFNTRIPGIGPAKSLTILKQRRRIKKIKDFKTKCLNYKTCKKLLSPRETGISDISLEIDTERTLSGLDSISESSNSTELRSLVKIVSKILKK